MSTTQQLDDALEEVRYAVEQYADGAEAFHDDIPCRSASLGYCQVCAGLNRAQVEDAVDRLGQVVSALLALPEPSLARQ